jgi:hypothetical protein
MEAKSNITQFEEAITSKVDSPLSLLLFLYSLTTPSKTMRGQLITLLFHEPIVIRAYIYIFISQNQYKVNVLRSRNCPPLAVTHGCIGTIAALTLMCTVIPSATEVFALVPS